VDLFEELEAAQPHRTVPCTVCTWLSTLDHEEQAKWDKVMAESPKVYSHTSVHVISQRHGATVGYVTVRKHRVEGHRQ
jgi:hypothetical protein